MKRQYIKPTCEVLDGGIQQCVLGMSVYNLGQSKSIATVGNGTDPNGINDDDDSDEYDMIIWND